MHVREFESHLFSIGKEEFNTLFTCISHLNYRNFSDESDKYKLYKKHHHQYGPYVQIRTLKYKVEESKSTGVITLIEPEIRWLCKGLEELAKLSLDDTDNALNEDTENGTWALDYTKIQLNILTEFRNAINEKEPNRLWDRYDELNEITNHKLE